MLQVLHKTNAFVLSDGNNDESFGNKEKDPIEILTRGMYFIVFIT